MSAVAGTFVNDNVRLSRPLAAGAMGQVWVADHLTLKIPVAVKLMHDKLTDLETSAVQRFSEEASIAAGIKSPHVVQTLDSGVMEDGTPFIVMELLEGESLEARLARGGQLSVEETARVVMHVCRALDAAHKIGTIHRDIKPDNVFLTSTDEGLSAKVFDFGIATSMRLPEGWEASGDMAGTPPFLSPEQFRGEEVDRHADMWAVAVVAYLCLTGTFPFRGDTLGLLSVSVMSGTFALPSHERKDLPREVDAWFDRAFAYEKERRFSTAREMGAAFMGFAAPEKQAKRWSATTLGGAVVALGAVAAIGWFVARQTADTLSGVVATPPRASAKQVGVSAPEPTALEDEPTSAPVAPEVPPPISAPTAKAVASDKPAPAPVALPAPPRPRPPTNKPTKGGEDYGF